MDQRAIAPSGRAGRQRVPRGAKVRADSAVRRRKSTNRYVELVVRDPRGARQPRRARHRAPPRPDAVRAHLPRHQRAGAHPKLALLAARQATRRRAEKRIQLRTSRIDQVEHRPGCAAKRASRRMIVAFPKSTARVADRPPEPEHARGARP